MLVLLSHWKCLHQQVLVSTLTYLYIAERLQWCLIFVGSLIHAVLIPDVSCRVGWLTRKVESSVCLSVMCVFKLPKNALLCCLFVCISRTRWGGGTGRKGENEYKKHDLSTRGCTFGAALSNRGWPCSHVMHTVCDVKVFQKFENGENTVVHGMVLSHVVSCRRSTKRCSVCIRTAHVKLLHQHRAHICVSRLTNAYNVTFYNAKSRFGRVF